ncbi:hypothetical protein PINS_up023137 [Pythium insidiosum]|nr:hypothetical protein PINS_up023137 [Pythium insidiosum]
MHAALRFLWRPNARCSSRWFAVFHDRRQCLFGREGLFGVEYPGFDAVYAARKCVQIVLQFRQAYYASLQMSRDWRNHMYVTSIVVNCWVTPVLLLLPQLRRPLNLLAKRMLAPSCRLPCITSALDGSTDEEWKAFCDALAANTTVEYVHITSGNSLVRALAEQENRRVLHRTQTKLAFLSVLRRRQAASSSCSAGQLDAAIVSSVFAFAATSVQRRVRGSVVATMW